MESAKESSAELAQVKAKLETVEKEGQAHDEELTGLLVPLAEALAGWPPDTFHFNVASIWPGI